MNEFKFSLGDEVLLFSSQESGVVIGRASYSFETDKFFVQYVAADGRQVTDWFAGPQLLAQ